MGDSHEAVTVNVQIPPALLARLDAHVEHLELTAPGGCWTRETALLNLLHQALDLSAGTRTGISPPRGAADLDQEATYRELFEGLARTKCSVGQFAVEDHGTRRPALVLYESRLRRRVFLAFMQSSTRHPGGSRFYVNGRLRVRKSLGVDLASWLEELGLWKELQAQLGPMSRSGGWSLPREDTEGARELTTIIVNFIRNKVGARERRSRS